MNSLLQAIKQNDIGTVQRLLTYSPSYKKLVSYQSSESMESPLFCASVRGYTGVVRWLLMRGAKVDLKTTWGATALHAASERGHEAIVRLLVENKSPLNLQTQYGDTALHLAAYRGHLSVVILLIAAGIDVSIKNSKGRTALEEAELAGHDLICRHLSYQTVHSEGDKLHQSKVDLMRTGPLHVAVSPLTHTQLRVSSSKQENTRCYDNSAKLRESRLTFTNVPPETRPTNRVHDWVMNSAAPEKTIQSADTTRGSKYDPETDEMDNVFESCELNRNTLSQVRGPPVLGHVQRKKSMLKDIGKSQSWDNISPTSGRQFEFQNSAGAGPAVRSHPRCCRVRSLERAMEELQHELLVTREEVERANADIHDIQDMMRLCWKGNAAGVHHPQTRCDHHARDDSQYENERFVLRIPHKPSPKKVTYDFENESMIQ